MLFDKGVCVPRRLEHISVNIIVLVANWSANENPAEKWKVAMIVTVGNIVRK